MNVIKVGDRVRVTEKYPGDFNILPGRTARNDDARRYGICVRIDGEPEGPEGEYPFAPSELEVLD